MGVFNLVRKKQKTKGTLWLRTLRITPKITIGMMVATIIFLVFGLALSIFIIIDQRLKPTLLQIAEAKANQIATQAANRAVNEKIAQSIRFEDLVHIIQDNSGRPVFVQHNTGEINRLLSEVALEVQNALILTDKFPVKIPIGQIFGSQLLATWGPQLSINLVPVGTIETSVLDKVESVGINVNRYRLYASLTTRVKIVVPLISAHMSVTTQVVLTDFLVVGDVPQVYMDVNPKTLKGIFEME